MTNQPHEVRPGYALPYDQTLWRGIALGLRPTGQRDYRDVFAVPDLTPLATVLRDDAVPFGVWARPWEGSCSLLVDVPRNGVAVEIRSETWGGWLSDACAARSFDLCATD